ncbi:MAG TPA: M1 family metallopeptidase [Bacteroidia bacterium]|nr:M1 family metallopeptidase [Bacteroidia bacterium]
MKKIPFLLIVIIAASCGAAGIHFTVHNPKKAGKYPKRTQAIELMGNQESKYRTCFDATYYKLDVSFGKNIETDHSISGTVAMNAVCVSDFDTLQIDLAKNMNCISIHKADISSSGETPEDELKFYRREGAMFVLFPKTVHKGETFGLIISYNGTPLEAKRPPWAGGFVWKKDDLGNPWDGVACETEGASLWWPCKDVVNDEPDSADMSFTVPDNLVAVSNGRLVSRAHADEAAGMKTFDWHVSYPINLYDITFYIGKFKLLHDIYVSPVTHDTLQLNHYVLEQHYDKAKTQFAQLKDYLAFYEQTYGPYPWYRDGFKLVESPYEGMEHQTAIAYGNGFKNDEQWGFDYIILHETAHEWWGNSVTAYDLGDGWLHEGFATYTEALWVEHKFGHDAYERYLLFDRLFIGNERPVSRPYNIRYFDYHDEDIYMKGTWVLHSLRYVLNDDSLFFGILHSFYGKYKYSNATSKDFEDLVNEKTGKDYTWFFRQYLYNRFTPELHYCLKDGYLYYKWEKTADDFVMPAKVEVYGHIGTWLDVNATAVSVGRIPYSGERAGVFNDRKFLFKPVEDVAVARLYGKSG